MKIVLSPVQAVGLIALAGKRAAYERVGEKTLQGLVNRGLVEKVERDPSTAPNGRDHAWQLTSLGTQVAKILRKRPEHL